MEYVANKSMVDEVLETTKNAQTWKECVYLVNSYQRDTWLAIAAEMEAE